MLGDSTPKSFLENEHQESLCHLGTKQPTYQSYSKSLLGVCLLSVNSCLEDPRLLQIAENLCLFARICQRLFIQRWSASLCPRWATGQVKISKHNLGRGLAGSRWQPQILRGLPSLSSLWSSSRWISILLNLVALTRVDWAAPPNLARAHQMVAGHAMATRCCKLSSKDCFASFELFWCLIVT